MFTLWTHNNNGVFQRALKWMDALPAQLSSLTASAPSSVLVGSPTAITGKLVDGGGTGIANQDLTITALTPTGPITLPSVTTGSDGSYAVPLVPNVPGHTIYQVTYDGQPHQAPTAALASLDVLRRTGSITLSASATTSDPGQPITLTVQTAASHGSSGLTLTATDSEGTQTVSTGNLDAGTATFSVTPTQDMTYTVTWAGDDWDTATNSTPITIAVRPTTTITGGPAPEASRPDATITFTSSDPNATHTCAVDGNVQTCTSPLLVNGLTDGPHTVTVTGQSPAGAVGAPTSISWAIDTHAPTAHATLTLASPTSSTHLLAHWTSTDAAPSSGISHYQVRITDLTGRLVYAAQTTTSSATFASGQGITYLLTVTAVDKAGNASSPSTATYTVPIDDARFSYSTGWLRGSCSSCFNGSTGTASTAGHAAQFSGTGRNYILWVTMGPRSGRATVTLNGHVLHTLDLYSATTRYRVPLLIYSSSIRATRTLVITVLGTRRAGSAGTAIQLDAAQIQL